MKKNIYTKDLEDTALEQFDDCTNESFVTGAALMPDAHTGYVAPIGAVIKTKGAVVPAWVGYDIGCGMIALKLSNNIKFQERIKANAEALFDEVNKTIPMGAGKFNQNTENISSKASYKIGLSLGELKNLVPEDGLYKEVKKRTLPSLGTLGSGNHFIEILEYKDETWLVIHSGSRGVGHFVGTHFMKEASGVVKGYEKTEPLKNDISKNWYMSYQNYCLDFALQNRMDMAYRVGDAIKKILGKTIDMDDALWTNKNHNHCVYENGEYIHRKGATTSNKGEKGVIPANMRDGCFLVIGKGNEDFICSSSHGAGRKMSRKSAKENITMETFKEQMKGITAPVKEKVIDESPGAYKDIYEVMELQKDSVHIVKHLKPIINWKGF